MCCCRPRRRPQVMPWPFKRAREMSSGIHGEAAAIHQPSDRVRPNSGSNVLITGGLLERRVVVGGERDHDHSPSVVGSWRGGVRKLKVEILKPSAGLAADTP
jgi:hypothetical protein